MREGLATRSVGIDTAFCRIDWGSPRLQMLGTQMRWEADANPPIRSHFRRFYSYNLRLSSGVPYYTAQSAIWGTCSEATPAPHKRVLLNSRLPFYRESRLHRGSAWAGLVF